MTTDAKIGLLLGLVFIVIIAFVINGLPSFHKDQSSNDLTNNYVTQVGGKDAIGLPNSRSFDAANSDTNAALPSIAQRRDPITQVNNVIETPLPTKEMVMAVGPEKPLETIVSPNETPQTPAATAAMPAESVDTPTLVAASEQQSTTYIVKKGDNLGLIAQNCYGTQGPKKENVSKIIKANKLKSKQIYVGQKLVIPNPTALASSAPSMFEKVQSVTKSLTAPLPAKETSAAENGMRDYVVKSGDYPWKIAKKELGDGNRYKDILKCNPTINENTKLSIGMHLKLPQR